jgi:hypothetical protein
MQLLCFAYAWTMVTSNACGSSCMCLPAVNGAQQHTSSCRPRPQPALQARASCKWHLAATDVLLLTRLVVLSCTVWAHPTLLPGWPGVSSPAALLTCCCGSACDASPADKTDIPSDSVLLLSRGIPTYARKRAVPQHKDMHMSVQHMPRTPLSML